jgi:hypothetical protein
LRRRWISSSSLLVDEAPAVTPATMPTSAAMTAFRRTPALLTTDIDHDRAHILDGHAVLECRLVPPRPGGPRRRRRLPTTRRVRPAMMKSRAQPQLPVARRV